MLPCVVVKLVNQMTIAVEMLTMANADLSGAIYGNSKCQITVLACTSASGGVAFPPFLIGKH